MSPCKPKATGFLRSADVRHDVPCVVLYTSNLISLEARRSFFWSATAARFCCMKEDMDDISTAEECCICEPVLLQ